MARRGFAGTALRAALGATSGVIEGMQQRDVREAERQEKEAARQRQAMYDALALADRGALPVAQGRLAGGQATAEIGKAAMSAMNLAGGGTGAIPYSGDAIASGAQYMGPPMATFKVGGVEYAMPSPEVRRTSREAAELASDLRKREQISALDQRTAESQRNAASARMQDLLKAAKGKRKDSPEALQLLAESPKLYEMQYPQPAAGSPMDALRIEEARTERAQQEIMGLAYLKQNPKANEAWQKLSTGNPRYAKMSPGAIGYALMEQELKTAPKQSQGMNWLLPSVGGQPGAPAPTGGSVYQQFRASGGIP